MTDDQNIPAVDQLAAALRQDAADVDVYARVLTETLADSLPADAVRVERKRSLAGRFSGRAASVSRLEVELADKRLVLVASKTGRPAGEVVQVVRGVVLSRRPVALDEWLSALAAELAARAGSDARARQALERFVLGG